MREPTSGKISWSRQKRDLGQRDLGEEVYYDPVVHDAQLLYILARHFSARERTRPKRAG